MKVKFQYGGAKVPPTYTEKGHHMIKPSYNVKLTESQRDQLHRYLNDQAQQTIKEMHQIEEINKFEEIYDAYTRCQLQSLTARLKWYNMMLDVLQKAKKI